MQEIGRQWVRSLLLAERVITCGEVFELRLPLPKLCCDGDPPNLGERGDPAAPAIKEALRMRPSCIV